MRQKDLLVQPNIPVAIAGMEPMLGLRHFAERVPPANTNYQSSSPNNNNDSKDDASVIVEEPLLLSEDQSEAVLQLFTSF